MAILTTTQLSDWVKRQLGSPNVTVQATDAQILDAINEAVDLFLREAHEVQRDWALVLPLSAGVKTYNLATHPNTSGYTIIDVQGFDLNQGSMGDVNQLFTVENQLFYGGDLYSSLNGANLIAYEIAMQWVELFNQKFVGKYHFDWNKYSKQLTILPTPITSQTAIISVHTLIDGYATSSNATTIYDEIWVRDYSLAKTKYIIGLTYGKFTGVDFPGGGDVNADMYREGKDEMEKLREDLQHLHAKPLPIFYG